MVRGRPICKDIRELVINKFKSGKSLKDISNDLNLSKSSVQYIIKSYQKLGSTETKVSNRGRKSKLTSRDLRTLSTVIKENRRSTVRNLSKEWSERISKPVGREWTRKNLHKINYSFYKAKKKPLLTALQKKKRLTWAKNKLNWVQRQWDSIIFSDECKFDVCVGDERSRIIRKKNEAYHRDCLRRTVKFPASVMVWGCMSAKGVGNLHFINGIVNAQNYINILDVNLNTSIQKLRMDEFVFQQDGATPHTAKLTKNWFQEKNINVLDWPSSSPDLNPIESLWAIMKRKLRNEPARNLQELRNKIQDIWDSISPEECKTLISSMKLRCKEVIT